MNEKIVKIYQGVEEVCPATVTQAVLHTNGVLVSEILDHLTWKDE